MSTRTHDGLFLKLLALPNGSPVGGSKTIVVFASLHPPIRRSNSEGDSRLLRGASYMGTSNGFLSLRISPWAADRPTKLVREGKRSLRLRRRP